MKQGTEVTKDQVQTSSSQSTAPVQPSVIRSETQTPVFEPVVAPSKSKVRQSRAKVIVAKMSTSSSTPAVSSKVSEVKDMVRALLLDKNNQSSAPASSSTPAPVKAIEPNYEKLSEMTRTPMNEHCSAIILNKVPRILGDPDKFRIPCEFPRMDECLALANLGASINLMPLSVWEGLSLLELTPTCMTLKLEDRSVSKPIGIAKDVSVKTGRALIDVHKGELTLCIENESITYNLDQTEKLSEMTRTPMNERCSAVILNKVPRILGDPGKFRIPCEFPRMDECLALADLGASINLMPLSVWEGLSLLELTPTCMTLELEDRSISKPIEVLCFSDVTASGNPTPYDDPIVSTTSPTFTLFEDSDFLFFEEADAFLSLEVDPNLPEFNPFYYDPEGDILLLEAILNSEPLPPLPNHKQYIPSYKKELKVCEAKTVKSSVDEPPEGINPEFCTHKILIEEDYKPSVQHQRRINPKIHDVIKKEVKKLLDAGLIYPISDSLWVSPRVCIDYRKLNEATRKDHFPLPFMDQMLERLARNEYYCFLDGFFGYFQIPIDPRDQEKTTFTTHMARLPIDACPSVCAMHRAHYKEHPSDTKVFTMKMEILLEPTSNKLLVEDMQELFRKLLNDVQNIHEELAEYINTSGWNRPAFYDDDDMDYIIAITPVLSTEEPVDSLSMRDEHLDTIPATDSDVVIKSNVEDLVSIPSEFEVMTTLSAMRTLNEEIEDNNLREKLLNVHLLIANIKALKDNPTPSSELLNKSSSTSHKSFLEETNTFHNSLIEFENFCCDLKEISSGSTTTHSDISLLDYEAFSFSDDHIEEISSGSITTHSDVSLSEYDSFIFDLPNDQFPPTDRSDFTHEEFVDELAHIISPPKYDCFYFWNLPDLGELLSILNFGIRENLSFTTRVNLPVKDDHSPLLAYVVCIFLAYLTYPVIPPYLHSFKNDDTIFDPGITINRFYLFNPGLSHRRGTFKKFNTHRSHLNESPMEMLFSTCFPKDQ
nr:reverse transcriptase domain-containing protein [Tanacetum cinerariifolium]